MKHRSQKIVLRHLPDGPYWLLWALYASSKVCYQAIIKSGFFRSAYRFQSLASNNGTLPWFSYPAIEYLRRIKLSNKRVFEFGSGSGTLWWQERVASMVCVEDCREWYNKIKPHLRPNVKCIFAGNKEQYLEAACYHGLFDIVIIDGSYRDDCVGYAVKCLQDNGIIVVDDSSVDGYGLNASNALKQNKDFLGVDFWGFKPAVPAYSSTTFFWRK